MFRITALPALRSRGLWRDLADGLSRLFGRPPRAQFGALCYRRTYDGSGARTEVLLITSRDTGRWVIPKGWPMKGRTAAQAAALEAFEEAGMRGAISEEAIGRFAYDKVLGSGLSVRCIVQVHAMAVESCEEDFPERNQRRLAWFAPKEAAERVAEPGLKRLLARFEAPEGPARS